MVESRGYVSCWVWNCWVWDDRSWGINRLLGMQLEKKGDD